MSSYNFLVNTSGSIEFLSCNTHRSIKTSALTLSRQTSTDLTWNGSPVILTEQFHFFFLDNFNVMFFFFLFALFKTVWKYSVPYSNVSVVFFCVCFFVCFFHESLTCLSALTDMQFDRANVSVLGADCTLTDLSRNSFPFEEETRDGEDAASISLSRSEDRYFRRNMQR